MVPRRRARRARTWLFWALGAAVIVALAAVTADPALLPLLLAPESVALLFDSAVLYAVAVTRASWLPWLRALRHRTWRAIVLAHLRIECAFC